MLIDLLAYVLSASPYQRVNSQKEINSLYVEECEGASMQNQPGTKQRPQTEELIKGGVENRSPVGFAHFHHHPHTEQLAAWQMKTKTTKHPPLTVLNLTS